MFDVKSIECDITFGVIGRVIYRSGNTLRFPRAAEPPHAGALRGLTYASHPAVSAYFLRCFVLYNHISCVVKPLLWLLIGVEASRLLREKHVSEDPAAAVFREEAEAVPAESDWPERKST
ncbi:hypothetical protein Len3610_11340 [Lentibacillus sp. CBA3610]|nr:hypothetical protein Len3610_11340 [Lentibacillus sp. CBA3610]